MFLSQYAAFRFLAQHTFFLKWILFRTLTSSRAFVQNYYFSLGVVFLFSLFNNSNTPQTNKQTKKKTHTHTYTFFFLFFPTRISPFPAHHNATHSFLKNQKKEKNRVVSRGVGGGH